MLRPIYNLEFPSYCTALELHGYRFSRVPEYQERLLQLHHTVAVFSEYDIGPNTGTHAHTALVELRDPEPAPVLEWGDQHRTALDDICLLLSLFTGRHVFSIAFDEMSLPIVADPRTYQWGGILRVSVPYEAAMVDEGEIPFDCGFEKGLVRIYELMHDEKWQQLYGKGYVLFLTRQAFAQRVLEAAFTQCWTIWEHLFSVMNRHWLSTQQMEKLSSIDKIAFILSHFGIWGDIDTRARQRLSRFTRIRNRLVHNGRFPEDTDRPLAKNGDGQNPEHLLGVLFIRLTECVVAKMLELVPSNIFNTREKLEEFMQSSS